MLHEHETTEPPGVSHAPPPQPLDRLRRACRRLLGRAGTGSPAKADVAGLDSGAECDPRIPKPIVAKVSQAIAEILQLPDVKARFEPQGVELKSSPPDTFDAVIRSDAERYGKIIKPPAN